MRNFLKISFWNPISLSVKFLVFRHGSPEWFRGILYKIFLWVLNNRYSKSLKSIPQPNQQTLKKLKTDGFLRMNNISQSDFDFLNKEIESIAPEIIKDKSGKISKDIYTNDKLLSCESIIKLISNPSLYGLVRKYLECPPIIQYVTAWRTYENEQHNPEMYFHMDHHGQKFLKLFIYMTDVFEGDGHHEFLKSSHDWVTFKKSKLIKNNKNLANEIIKKRRLKGSYKMDNSLVTNTCYSHIEKFTGKAGSVFIEDTSGLHRGTYIKNHKSRLIFQVLFTPFNSRKDQVPRLLSNKNIGTLLQNNPLPEDLLNRLFSQVINKI